MKLTNTSEHIMYSQFIHPVQRNHLKTSNRGLECDNLFLFHSLSDIVTEKERFLNKIHLIGIRV